MVALLCARALAFYLRRSPNHRGKWRIAMAALRLAPHLKLLRGPHLVQLQGGGRLHVDGSSQTGRILYLTGEYEPATTRLMQRVLSAGDLMVDVGANIGYFSVTAARRVGPNGRVLAFEPGASPRTRLIENLQLNALTNVEVRTEALGASGGAAAFYTGPDDDTGLASFRPLSQSERVEVRRLRFDDLPTEWGSPRVVKIDVEGAELDVLRGMSECLTRSRPDLIVEVTDAFLRVLHSSAEELYAFLRSHGYRVFQVCEDGVLDQVREPADFARLPPQFNAFCSAR